jgi:hypothetical protein
MVDYMQTQSALNHIAYQAAASTCTNHLTATAGPARKEAGSSSTLVHDLQLAGSESYVLTAYVRVGT